MATPGMVTNWGLNELMVASNKADSDKVGLDKASWITGILEAEYLITKGGVMPGGNWLQKS